MIGEAGMNSTSINLHHPSSDIDIENNVESEAHKDASQGDLSEEELADRYYIFCCIFSRTGLKRITKSIKSFDV